MLVVGEFARVDASVNDAPFVATSRPRSTIVLVSPPHVSETIAPGIPIRTWNGRSNPLSRHSCSSSCMRRCMAIAILTQAFASSFVPFIGLEVVAVEVEMDARPAATLGDRNPVAIDLGAAGHIRIALRARFTDGQRTHGGGEDHYFTQHSP